LPFLRLLLLTLSALAVCIAAAQLPSALLPERDSSLVANSQDLTDEQAIEALKKLNMDDIDALSKREIAELAKNPLDFRALQNLSILLAMRGEPQKTDQLNLQLARYSLRNHGAQVVAVNILIGKAGYEEALLRLDAVLRSDPTTQSLLFPTIVKLAENQVALRAIAATVAKQPPWRKSFMTYVSTNETSGLLTYKILKAMREAGGTLQNDELRNILSAWMKSSEYERAYFVWLDLLSDEELGSLKLIYDGQFSREARNQFFDWTLGTKDNVSTAIVRRPGSAVERSLLLNFVGYKANFSHVSQMLRLTPGVYDISFDHMAQAFTSPGGLVWRVRCMGTNQILGVSETISQSVPWNRSSFSVTIPEESCDTQILRLESASVAVRDTAVDGQLYFDDFAIDRKESATPQ
jgi:hypothetical protein